MTGEAFRYTYQNIQQINKGGTGVIYRARHRNLEKTVVLKRITLNQDIRFLRREVDILKNLRHRYLPTIYDFIEVDGAYFIVEDFIEGTDLQQYINSRVAVPEPYVKKWLRQICEVLDYLHTRPAAVIHSDIKPANIMVDTNGDICLIDFNISVLCGERVAVLGFSNFYCAPEQVAKARNPEKKIPIDARTDIYSTAATFYTLLSGVVPKTDRRNKPLAMMGLPYHEGLLRLIDKGMAPDPAERWQSAKQMLAQFSRLDRLTLRAQKRKKLLLWASAAAAVILVAGSVAGVYGAYRNRQRQYKTAVSEIIDSYEKKGATEELDGQIERFLADDSYAQFLKDEPVSEAYFNAMQAEYQYDLNTDKAQQKYEAAWNLIRDSDDADADKKQEFAANYARALALNGKRTEAEQVASRYLDSQTGIAAISVRVSIEFRAGNYGEVLSLADSLPADAGNQKDRISLYKLVISSAVRLGDAEATSKWVEMLTTLDPTDASYRFSAGKCAEIGTGPMYLAALRYYEKMRYRTEKDRADYAEILLVTKQYEKSIAELQKGDLSDKVLHVRQLCVLACAFAETGRSSAAGDYCKKAIRAYNALEKREQERIPDEMMDKLKIVKNNLGVGDEIRSK